MSLVIFKYFMKTHDSVLWRWKGDAPLNNHIGHLSMWSRAICFKADVSTCRPTTGQVLLHLTLLSDGSRNKIHLFSSGSSCNVILSSQNKKLFQCNR